MRTKSRFLISALFFVFLGMIIIPMGDYSSFTDKRLTDPNTALSGTWGRTGKIIYAQNLGEVTGLAVEGINSINGQNYLTDLVIAGTTGFGSWRSIEGYYSNTSTGLPVIRSSTADTARTMVKYKDPNDNNTDIIYGLSISSDEGAIVRQRGVNPSKNSNGEVIPEWTLSTSAPVDSMCLGNFTSSLSLQLAAVCENGMVYIMDNLNSASAGTVTKIDPITYHSDYRFVKNLIVPINNLDNHGLGWQDIIVGHYKNVTAISTNNSRDIIWNIQLPSAIDSVIAVEDQNGDNLSDVAVATQAGLYLLSGANGSILSSLTNAGTYFRDIQVFNNSAVITGDYQGRVYIWDINASSPTFGDALINQTFASSGWAANCFLNIGDINNDGFNDFAVGGDELVGVLLGNNGTWLWKAQPNGASYWLAARSINIYDMTLMNDMDGDSTNDFAVTGTATNVQDSAIFIFSSQGQYTFTPDLTGYGTVDLNCTTSDHLSTYSLTVYQAQGLTVDAKVIIDDVMHNMTINSTTLDWKNGVNFIYQTKLDKGIHTYAFNITDTNGDSRIVSNSNGPSVDLNCSKTQTSQQQIPGALTWLIVANIGIAISIVIISKKKIFRKI